MSTDPLTRCPQCGGAMDKARAERGMCFCCETYGPTRPRFTRWRFAWETPTREVYQVDGHGNRIVVASTGKRVKPKGTNRLELGR